MKSVRSMIRAPVRMDQATDGRSGCSRQGAARQAANNRGAVRQVRFYDFTPARTISGRGAFYLGSLSGSPFPVSSCGKTAGSPGLCRWQQPGRTSRLPLHGRNNFSAGRNLLHRRQADPADAWPRHTGHLVLYAQRYLPFARFISFPFSRLRRRGEIRSVKTMPSMWSYSCWMTQAFSPWNSSSCSTKSSSI